MIFRLKKPIIGREALREAADANTELRDHIELVRDAITKEVAERTGRKHEDEVWVYVDAIYSDRAIVEDDGRYYQYPYSVSDDKTVTLGERTEVVREFTPVEASKRVSSALIEAIGADDDDKPASFLIRVIRAGASGNRNFYPDSVLREAVPLFEGARVFAKADDEHLKGQGKSVRNLIGGLREAQFVEGAVANTGEIRAVLDVFESVGEVASMLREAIQRNMMNLFGFSIDVDGQVKRSGKLIEAVKFIKVHSVDLIIEPGAGGQLINLIEAVGQNNADEEDDMLKEKMLAKIREANGGKLPEGLDVDNDEAVFTAFREAEDTLREAAAAAAADDDESGGEPVTRAELQAFQARQSMREAVNATNLPTQTKTRLISSLEREPELTDARVKEAIKAERDYLASLTESGKPVDLGVYSLNPGDASTDGVAEMLTKLFDDQDREVISIKECYIEATGDKHVTGRLRECRRMRLAEAIDSTTFPELLGDEMQRRMLDRYNGDQRFDVYKRVVSGMPPFTDFRTRKAVRVGGYGDLPIVAENGAYNALTTPGEEAPSYGPAKRGGTETVSLEAIKNDDVGLITKIPGRLGTAAKRTLSKFVMDFLRTNPTIYDGVALFHASHNNLLTAALDKTAYMAARLAMKKQVELGVAAEQMGLDPAVLLIPADLEETAFNIFQRGTNVDPDLAQSTAPFIAPVWCWSDVNDWVLAANGNDVDLIELGFLDNKQEPEMFIQDMPSQGSLFTNDQIKYKIRHIYGGVISDYRGFHKNVVV